MSKKITLPERFSIFTKEGEPKKTAKNPWLGTVAFFDNLTLPQVKAIEDVMENKFNGFQYLTAFDEVKLPALLKCVEKWELINFPKEPTVDTVPLSPRKTSHAFVEFLWDELIKIYSEDQLVPNE